MTSYILDASAVIALLKKETGYKTVQNALAAGAACSAVNYSEVAQKIRAAGINWSTAASVLSARGLTVLDCSADDAVAAAALWQPGSNLSLADRFCLATAKRLSVPAMTADRAWGEGEGIIQIRADSPATPPDAVEDDK